MTRGHAPVDDGVGAGTGRVLSGAGVLLAAAVAADAGGVAALPGRARPAGWLLDATSGLVALLVLCGLVLLGSLVALLVRRPQQRKGELARIPIPPLTSRLVRMLVLLVAIAAIASPLVLLVTTPRLSAVVPPATTTSRAGVAEVPARAPRTSARTRSGSAEHHAGRDALLLAVMAGAVAAVAAGRATRRRNRDARDDDDGADGRDGPDLRTNVAVAATAAVTALDVADSDPRAAVIAAYTAMTRTLTAADPGMRESHTPGRLLERAAAAGVVDVSAATTLIRLFEHARFSPHPVTLSHVADARDALSRVRASAGTPAGLR